MSTENSDTAKLFSTLLPLVASDAFKDLSFHINCDIEGEQRGDRFEPKVKVNIQIARDMDKVLTKTALDAKIRKEEFETIKADQADRKAEQELEVERLLKMASVTDMMMKGFGVKDEKAKPDNHS